MNVLFAMGTPTTTDDTGYFLWLAHSWPVFLPPIIAICVTLVFWVRRMVHSSGNGTNTPGPTDIEAQRLGQEQALNSESDPPPGWPLEFEVV